MCSETVPDAVKPAFAAPQREKRGIAASILQHLVGAISAEIPLCGRHVNSVFWQFLHKTAQVSRKAVAFRAKRPRANSVHEFDCAAVELLQARFRPAMRGVNDPHLHDAALSQLKGFDMRREVGDGNIFDRHDSRTCSPAAIAR